MPLIATHILVEISRFLAQAFIAGLWQGMALVSVVALVLRLTPGLSAAVRYAIWSFAFGLAVMIPLLHWSASAVPSEHALSKQLHIGTAWAVTIAVIWVLSMAMRAAQLLMNALRLHRIWKRATAVSTTATISASLQNVSPSAQLCTSNDIGSPCVIGFFSPRLLIPASLPEKLTPSELEQIVLHESEHLRRHDDWINLLQKIGLVFFPLNPTLLWMDRRLSLERELACDAGVIASTKSPFSYARCLIRLAEHRLLLRGIALSLSASRNRCELAQRIHSTLTPGSHIPPRRVRLSTVLICAGLIVGGAAMVISPRFISFADAAVPVTQATDTVASPGEARPIPVAYRPTSEAHPVLLKADITPRKTRRAQHVSSSRAQLRNVHATTTKHLQPRLILTTFTFQSNTPSGAVPTSLAPNTTPPYAAVQFEDGWLIVQL